MRSIPPLTMSTILRRRTPQTIQERAAELRQTLLALQERLRRVETGQRGEIPTEYQPPRLSWGGTTRTPGGSSAHGSGLGQLYTTPAKPQRPLDLLIPSRPAANRQPTEHRIVKTAKAFEVRITFPVPVPPNEVRWERQGDVLEVEYLGKAFTYYHAFMVPAEGEPLVRQEGRMLTLSFPSRA
ncbi:MAG: hypothetical protein HYX94_00930 [Chloroflexi bacterium]|nr:hypothetical protein [Chloroflexota bacterium]